MRRGKRLGSMNVTGAIDIHRGSPPAVLGRTLIVASEGHFPNTGKRWWGRRRPRCIPAGGVPGGRNRLRCPRIIRHRCKAGRRDPCRGSCGPLQKKTLRTLALMPLNIGIAMVGCDPKLSVTSCTGFSCPWRMRRVCRRANRDSIPLASPEFPDGYSGSKGECLGQATLHPTLAPHGGFGPAAIFCGIGRFGVGSKRRGEYRQAAALRQDRRKVSGGAGLRSGIMGLPGGTVETRRCPAGWMMLAKRASKTSFYSGKHRGTKR